MMTHATTHATARTETQATTHASMPKGRMRHWLPLSLLLLILLASGSTRSSQVVLTATEDNSPTRLSMTYSRFSGFKETEITVKEGTPVEVNVDIVTESGQLDAWIGRKDSDADRPYIGNDIPTTAFSVTLAEPGTYVLHVEGRKHTGSYAFDWAK